MTGKADTSPSRRDLAFALGAGVFAAVVVLLRYGPVLDFWWTHDDLHHLLFVSRHETVEYFFHPEVWREFHGSNFTPLYPVLYELGLALFGFDPRPFHLAHLVLVLGTVGITVAFLRLWVDELAALYGAVLFAVSGPAIASGAQLMNCHYLLGLILGVGAWILFVRAVRGGRLATASAGGALYFAAMLCKELYVPIPLLLVACPEGPWRSRLRASVPFGVAAAIYLVWRHRMLGALASALPFSDLRTAWIDLPAKLPSLLVGEGLLAWTGLGALALAFAVHARRQPRHLLVAGVGLVALVAPLVTIAPRIDRPERALVFWAWAAAVASTLLLSDLARRSTPTGVLALVAGTGILAGTFLTGADTLQRHLEEERHFRTVGRFVSEAPSEAILLVSGYPWAARKAAELRDLRGLGPPPKVVSFADEILPSEAARPVYEYDPRSDRIRRVVDVDERIRGAHASLRDAPLTVVLRDVDGGTAWRFGPYADRGYSIWIPDRNVFIHRARPEGFVAGGQGAMRFQVRYAHPTGWQTRSDWLSWENQPGERLEWRREAATPIPPADGPAEATRSPFGP